MNLKERLQNYVRILSIAKRPNSKEFWDTVRICAIGIAIVGAIGFIFSLISVFVGV